VTPFRLTPRFRALLVEARPHAVRLAAEEAAKGDEHASPDHPEYQHVLFLWRDLLACEAWRKDCNVSDLCGTQDEVVRRERMWA
jgi:hypothetical protein